jgi:uncharacterized oxidoreductase
VKISGNTVLITGGATGIGLALAEAFFRKGNEVIICGRRKNKLLEAQKKLPKLHIKVCDISKDRNRKALFDWATSNFTNLNILVNNAGIQREIDLTQGIADLESGEDEIGVNLEAPIYLSALFIPHLIKQKESAIVNISSGLAFVPIAAMPVYCATKAAIHSFSLSLRHQLDVTKVKVYEVVPPIVDTELDKGARGQRGQDNRGIKPEEVAAATIKGVENDDFEIVIGMAQNLRMGARTNPEQAFKQINR